MLMALDKQKLINAEFAEKQKKYVCPICHELVILKHGDKMISHFAHYVSSNCVGNEGETQLHLRGKQQLLSDLNEKYPKFKLEVYLTSLKQRPDLLTGNLVIEYQCSPISNQRLKERVIGYRSQQIKSIWILGMGYFKKSLHAYSVLRFLRYQKQIGFYLLFLDSSQHCYYLKYQVTQIGDQLKYKLQRFYDYQALIKFMKNGQHDKFLQPDLVKITRLIENRIRFQDASMMKLQQKCYQNRHLVTGCPLLVHYSFPNFPFLNRDWLAWKVKIVLYLENNPQCKLVALYDLAECNEFLFIENKSPVLPFLKLLEKYNYVKINQQDVFLIKNFIWYRDTYDKIDAIKKIKKRH